MWQLFGIIFIQIIFTTEHYVSFQAKSIITFSNGDKVPDFFVDNKMILFVLESCFSNSPDISPKI